MEGYKESGLSKTGGEKGHEKMSRKIRSLMAAGLLTINSAAEAVDLPGQAIEDPADTNELISLITGIENGEQTSIEGLIAERLRDVSLNYPNEISLILIEKDGVILLDQHVEGDAISVKTRQANLNFEGVDMVYYIHTHAINGVAETYVNPQLQEARDHFEVVTPDEDTFRAQLELMRDGLLPMIKTPPGWDDFNNSVIRKYQLISNKGNNKGRFIAAGPSGMWDIVLSSGEEGDSKIERFTDVYDKYMDPENEKYDEKKLDGERYIKLNLQVIGPYDNEAVDAYLKGYKELLLEEVEERDKKLEEMIKIAKKWDFDIEYTSY